MFTPLPMQHIELSVLTDDAPRAALLLANYGSFNPDTSEMPPDQFPEVPGEAYSQIYAEARAHLDKILAYYDIVAPESVETPMQPIALQQLLETQSWLKSVWDKCSAAQERMRRLHDEHRHSTQLLRTLDQFMDISVDLTLFNKKSSLLNVCVGTLPRTNLRRFEEALGLAGYIAIRLSPSEEYLHMIVAGAAGQSQEIDRVLQSAGWRTIEIPPEFHGRPDEVCRELTEHLAQMTEQEAQENRRRRAELEEGQLRERLIGATHILARAAPYAEVAGLIRGRGSLATVSGWVPSSRLPTLKSMLTKSLGDRFALQVREPRADERLQVPSAIRHQRWLQPFARLVLNYGVPRYGEIDPTVPFAATFVVMFGMMFGDVGHGATIVLFGLLLRRRLGQYARLAVVVGLSSAVFGLLYGSVFGFEQLLPALWISPLSDPMRMLGVALAWGIGFIFVANLLTIRNRMTDGQLRDALFDSRGAAGLLLYIGLLLSAWLYATSGVVHFVPMLVGSVALGGMLARSWQHNRGIAIGERLLITLMEGLESIMAYISNTLSFLRLAAFSLNHVALSIAILTMASILHTTGYWVTIALGNVFILVLEGAIVGIQTLRLEYYEGFSRFFGGNGRAFRPLTLGKRQGVAVQHK